MLDLRLVALTRATKVGCFKVGICRNSGFESVRQL